MGRKRKSTAKRHPGGQLVRPRGMSPAQVAARMPHRRGLGVDKKGVALAVDQRAECELGRMALRGWINGQQHLAGQQFARDYGQYLTTIAPPRQLGGVGQAFDCGGCLGMTKTDFCLCRYRRTIWEASSAIVRSAGPPGTMTELIRVVLAGLPCVFLDYLRLALDALVQHYGLTNQRKRRYQNTNSKTMDARP